MARKKRQTYNEVIAKAGNIQKEIDAVMDHMAAVFASQMDYATARILGDLTDRELRLVARLMFHFVRLFCSLALHGAKPRQRQGSEDEPMVEGELQYNNEDHCWEAWDAGKKVGTLYNGMCVELPDGTGWKPFKIRVMVTDLWSGYAMNIDEMDENDPNIFKMVTGLYGGLRVRFHKA